MTVSGPGVSETFEGPLTTPWAPQYLGVGTGSNAFPDANLAPYFDDIHAATDEPVPTDSKSWGAVKGLYR